jgi:hypothetical protein
LNQDKKRFKHLISSVCHRYHFSNPNTGEIIFTLLFLGIITRLLAVLSEHAKY